MTPRRKYARLIDDPVERAKAAKVFRSALDRKRAEDAAAEHEAEEAAS